MDDSEFTNMNDRHTYFCIGKQEEIYPCYKDGDNMKLIIKQTDYDGNRLLSKILFRFIDSLFIHGIRNLSSIVKETISVQSLRNMNVSNEDIYSYHEFKANFLDTLFRRTNKFIHVYETEVTNLKQSETRILNKNPYFVRRLYGEGVTITYMNEIKNKDFQLIVMAFQTLLSDEINEEMLKHTLQTKLKQSPDLLDVYNNEKQTDYTSIEEIQLQIFKVIHIQLI